jgi:hypothetical protein
MKDGIKISQLLIKFLYIRRNNLKFFEHRKPVLSFKLLLFLPVYRTFDYAALSGRTIPHVPTPTATLNYTPTPQLRPCVLQRMQICVLQDTSPQFTFIPTGNISFEISTHCMIPCGCILCMIFHISIKQVIQQY